MENENYLFFADGGDNDQANDAIMFPASRFHGAVSTDNTTLEFFFKDAAGANSNDDISCTITADKHEAVCNEFASLATRTKTNTNNFTVISDLNGGLPSNEGPISAVGITAITAMTITTA